MKIERILYKLESFFKKHISRRRFLKFGLGGLAILLSENKFLKFLFADSGVSTGRKKSGRRGIYDLVIAEGNDSYKNTVSAVAAMGGMQRFVNKGDVVVVKPNMGWDRVPAEAANTDPAVVAALVELCYRAGAKRVNVFDVPCNDERRVHENSGIARAAKEKGAFVYFVDHWNIVKAKFAYESPMAGWPILRDAVVCDTFINVPVLKHHGLTGLTLSMKNLMGVCSGKRGQMHVDIGRKLADLTDFISPDLTVIDATRVLTRNGPSGGNTADVITMNKLVVATDSVMADAFAASLMDKDPMSISYIREGALRGLGSADLLKANIFKVQV
jgi:uncharacterized protein (DUF362 family)